MSGVVINFYRNLTVIGFLISIPVCLAIAFSLYRIGKKYVTRKAELKNLLGSPDMGDVRWFRKRPLSEHGIKFPGSKQNKKRITQVGIEDRVTKIEDYC